MCKIKALLWYAALLEAIEAGFFCAARPLCVRSRAQNRTGALSNSALLSHKWTKMLAT